MSEATLSPESEIPDTATLRPLVERPTPTVMWGRSSTVHPRLVDAIFGRGDRLIRLAPMLTRPNYYVVRVDSAWGLGDGLRPHLDGIYAEIRDQFGRCGCEECRDDDGDESEWDHREKWPVPCFDGGTEWRLDDIGSYGGQAMSNATYEAGVAVAIDNDLRDENDKLRSANVALTQSLAVARAEAERGRSDSARLDYLESSAADVVRWVGPRLDSPHAWDVAPWVGGGRNGPTLRAAIDATMAIQEKEGA